MDDVKAAVGVFRYYAGWCDKIQGRTIPVGKVYMLVSPSELGAIYLFV